MQHAPSVQYLVLTGSDGVGKSTLCSLLLQELQAKFGVEKVALFSLWEYVQKGEICTVSKDALSFATSLSSRSRMSLLLFCFSRGLELLHAAHPHLEILLIDGYWFKYAANERARGVPPEEADLPFSLLPQADLVFYLQADPACLLKRKTTFTPYELGPESQGKSPQLQFQRFQQKLNGELMRMCDANPQWIPIHADADILTLHQELFQFLSSWIQTKRRHNR